MINVFIVGSKGIPARYGGFETFVENLTKQKKDNRIQYFVSCMGQKDERIYNNSLCFSLPTPCPGPVGRILHVSNALKWVESFVSSERKHDKNIVYILGCRIGPLLHGHTKRLHKLHCMVVCNPDGLEWKRGKWSFIEKKIIKYCEKELVVNSDYIVCDSMGIKEYLLTEYKNLKTKNVEYIAYGCDLASEKCPIDVYQNWLHSAKISPFGFYLVVGRFVPENNLFLIVREFMKSKTKKDLVIVTNVEKNKFYRHLSRNLHFDKDPRIKFVGTIYNQELLIALRENAFAYIHGHSVGGTNPSLLEALGHTKTNLLFDVPFNREVGEDQALYFSDQDGSLSSLIQTIENNPPKFNCEQIIERRFSWSYIVASYETFFIALK